jgi:hypothetical protein
MEIFTTIATTLLDQLQKPTLAFLIAGMLLAAMRSKFAVPPQVYQFIVVVLLLKVGMSAGISLRTANLAVPAVLAMGLGIAIVLLGRVTLVRRKGVGDADGMATAGLFGAVSASTLAAGMAMLDEDGMSYEGFIGALYPFMDVAALVTAIVLAKMSMARQVVTTSGGAIALGGGPGGIVQKGLLQSILADTLRSPAISALLIGLGLGLFARPDAVFSSFYEPLFRGFLSILMLIMGMEAWSRLSQLRKVAGVYVLYGLTAPLAHGALGFGAGLIAHQLTGFSGGGVVLLAVMASSSSDISGPPTMRGALPEANPSAYVGTSTGLGTPVAILSIPLWMALSEMFIG